MTQPGTVTTTRIGLIGDHDPMVTAHRAIPRALDLAAAALGAPVGSEWLPTDGLRDESRLMSFDGLWCVPASPYRSMEGALLAIRFARERILPFLGTCGGFQHAVIGSTGTRSSWRRCFSRSARRSPSGCRRSSPRSLAPQERVPRNESMRATGRSAPSAKRHPD